MIATATGCDMTANSLSLLVDYVLRSELTYQPRRDRHFHLSPWCREVARYNEWNV